MGLDTTHNCWHGAYSSFGQWRNAGLAVTAGYSLKQVTYGSGFTVDQADIDWSTIPAGAVEGEWSDPPKDALLIILCHSDCDGVIHPREAALLVDRLEQLIPLIPEDGDWGYRARTTQFVTGLREAVAEHQDVEFF